MNRCDQCGSELAGVFTLCPHHYLHQDVGWATTNRIMCDVLHRGVVPPRLETDVREDELYRALHEAA